MKNLLVLAILMVGFVLNVSAQDKPKSLPMTTTAQIDDVTVTINYSSPAVREREIWGALVPYGKVWRTGANDATTFSTSADVMIQGKKLAAGEYSLFTIPAEGKWTIIFNKNPKQWGAYSYDAAQDALRVEAASTASDDFKERFEIAQNGNNIVIMWENLAVPFTVSK